MRIFLFALFTAIALMGCSGPISGPDGADPLGSSAGSDVNLLYDLDARAEWSPGVGTENWSGFGMLASPGEGLGDRQTPLPAPLTVASIAAQCIAALNANDTEYAFFGHLDDPGSLRDDGFEVHWLTPMPSGPQGAAWYRAFADYPNETGSLVADPVDTDLVTRRAQAIIAALGDPRGCTNRIYHSDDFFDWFYAFDYTDFTGPRRIVMYQISVISG